MISSVRVTLTLWYVGILTLLLYFFGWLLYSNVSSNLNRDIDELLISQADGVSDAVFSFWKAEWPEGNLPLPNTAEERRGFGNIYEEIQSGSFPLLISQWADQTGELATFRPVRLLDRNGTVLEASHFFLQFDLPITDTAIAEAKNQQTVDETFTLDFHRIRMVTRPVVEDGQVLYFVQVATSLEQMDHSLNRLRLWLFWFIPTFLIITAAVGWWVITATLHPVNRMSLKAQQISATNLHERVEVPRTKDELEQLAKTFNEMLARLERAFKRLRQFSAAASHELRTPLTVMRGELELALRKPRPAEEYERVLQTQLSAIKELSYIVGQLLTIAHSEDGEESVEWQPVDLGALVRQVCEDFELIAESKQIRIEIAEQNSLWVRGERHLLERLLSNLLENALKHTPAKGNVTFQLKSDKNEACLIVQDTGPGIPEEELPKVFDKFFNRKTYPDTDTSTGLGLGLCRWIAEAHYGRIEVASALGEGARFTVMFPQWIVPK